jgi:hypothetical protein
VEEEDRLGGWKMVFDDTQQLGGELNQARVVCGLRILALI